MSSNYASLRNLRYGPCTSDSQCGVGEKCISNVCSSESTGGSKSFWDYVGQYAPGMIMAIMQAKAQGNQAEYDRIMASIEAQSGVKAPAYESNKYLPWIIGGGVALLGLLIIMSSRRQAPIIVTSGAKLNPRKYKKSKKHKK